jgi:hypothetical protein
MNHLNIMHDIQISRMKIDNDVKISGMQTFINNLGKLIII